MGSSLLFICSLIYLYVSMAGATILGISYGLDVNSSHDSNVEIAEEGLRAIETSTSPQARVFNFFPASAS